MVEKARSVEAIAIIGNIRKLALAYLLQNGSVVGLTYADCNIGSGEDQIPNPCRSTHYFDYYVVPRSNAGYIQITATRCTSEGKPPQGNYYQLTLWSDLITGEETRDRFEGGVHYPGW